MSKLLISIGDVLGGGTGFVVGGNVVVTAGHVIYDKFDYGGYGPVIKVYPRGKIVNAIRSVYCYEVSCN